MLPRPFIRAVLMLSILCTSKSGAQTYRFEGRASWTWQASADEGQTWTSGVLEVPQSASSVRVRANAWFEPHPNWYWGGGLLDATVLGLNGAGQLDALEDPHAGFTAFQRFSVTRFGPVLKLDDVADLEPPGVGSRWLYVNQPAPAGFPYTLLNELPGVVNYRFVLDGTAGDRLVSATWFDRQAPGVPPGPMIYLYELFHPTEVIYPEVTIDSLTIRVVPSPPGTAVWGAMLLSMRRRRGG